MRALFNRCCALTKLGATVILIHHTNRSGETRGSSDLKTGQRPGVPGE
jgi:RecA-family ATPase